MHYDLLTVALSVYTTEFDNALNTINDREVKRTIYKSMKNQW